MIKETETNGS